MLPPHGRIPCDICFAQGKTVKKTPDGWRLENNPCGWGSRNPRVLVLGFSKGTNQTARIADLPHDGDAFQGIAFKGMRHNVTTILHKLGVLGPKECVDGRINADERELAFGSLIRCSIAKYDPDTRRFLKSGDIIKTLANGGCKADFAANCARQFLAAFPPRLRLVVMLSNDDDYVDACREMMRRIHPGLRTVNGMAYAVRQVLFIHVVHPSGASGRHIRDWLDGKSGKQAEKREQSLAALVEAGLCVRPEVPLG
jgi:hypothetical protein